MKHVIAVLLVVVLGLLLLQATSFKKNDPYAAYAQTVHTIIERHWTYNKDAMHRKAIVHFKIGRDGNLEGTPEVGDPSGDKSYDALAVKAVYDSSPFPPLPKDYNEKTFEVFFEFSPAGSDKKTVK